MSPIDEPVSTHVPAWKKLGLKLKFAKEEPEDAIEHRNGHCEEINRKKRKAADASIAHGAEVTATERASKKSKKPKSKTNRPLVLPDDEGLSTANTEDKSSTPVPALYTPKASRKSVSFTPETKTEDGEGVKQLYKTWLEKQRALDPSFDPSTVSPALRPVLPPTAASDESAAILKRHSNAKLKATSETSPKKAKRLKQSKKEKNQEQSQTPQAALPPAEHPALTYLTTHHTSPNTWKFSKSYQNYLLKHLFSLTHIPTSHNSALLSYLRGLKGSARSRTRQQALAIRLEDKEWLSSEPAEDKKMDEETHDQCIARRKRDYDAAVARIKRQLQDKEDEREDREWEMLGDREDWERHLKKRRRAELVLWGVGEEEEIVEEHVALPRTPVSANSKLAVAEPVTIQSRGMGGVEQISVSGIAKGSAGKKTVFEEEITGVKRTPGEYAANGVGKVESNGVVNGARRTRKRKTKQRKTDVPDDDSSSESSSSSESEVENNEAPKRKFQQRPTNWFEEESSDESSFNSGSGSDSEATSSNEDRDSE